MSWLYDAHIHLSDPTYQNDIDLIINGMKQMQIKACCVSIGTSTSTQTLELSKKSDLIFPFIGIHPEMANKDDVNLMIQQIENNIETISGIGEIGLDPTYTTSEEDYKKQIYVFEKFLSIAEKSGKPISIHSRKSLNDILDLMTSYKIPNSLLHWFDGNKKQLRKAMDMDFFVSYGPVTVYANDKQSLLSQTREDKILIETDGPVRFSRCFEMKIAQIAFIPSIVFCASKTLKKSFYEMSMLIEKNSKMFLRI